ncbi:MAG: sporulation inhibitor of replication protein SirA [Bacilli bacterium]|nr:sporulation inhibitor of replication protein SirA [Bacilli bacterium]
MKVYYIFRLKKEFINLYKDNPSVLFNILKSIYFLDKTEVDYGYNLFNQLISPYKKNELDKNLYVKLHKEIPYSKRKDTHCINNLYKDEISRLVVNNFYLKLEVEQENSSFFEILNQELDNLFVCSFKNIDFFFLSEYLRKELV